MTRKKEIKRFIRRLEKIWLLHEDERFGQFLFNHTRFGTRAGLGLIRDIFYYQDKDIEEDLILKI